MVAISPHAGGVAFVDTLNCFSISQPHTYSSTSMHRFRHLLANSGRSRPPGGLGWPPGRIRAAGCAVVAIIPVCMAAFLDTISYFAALRMLQCIDVAMATCSPIQATAGRRMTSAGHKGASGRPEAPWWPSARTPSSPGLFRNASIALSSCINFALRSQIVVVTAILVRCCHRMAPVGHRGAWGRPGAL